MERVTNTLRNNYVAAQDIGQGQHDNRSLCTRSDEVELFAVTGRRKDRRLTNRGVRSMGITVGRR